MSTLFFIHNSSFYMPSADRRFDSVESYTRYQDSAAAALHANLQRLHSDVIVRPKYALRRFVTIPNNIDFWTYQHLYSPRTWARLRRYIAHHVYASADTCRRIVAYLFELIEQDPTYPSFVAVLDCIALPRPVERMDETVFWTAWCRPCERSAFYEGGLLQSSATSAAEVLSDAVAYYCIDKYRTAPGALMSTPYHVSTPSRAVLNHS